MAYTDRFYPDVFQPKKRSERGDLLKEVEDALYGGSPAPTPTPTPKPKPTSLAMLGAPTGVLSQNAVSRVNPSQANGSRYIGKGGTDLGSLYDAQGNVNPLPRGAVGAQGSPVFNQSLNGAQPTAQTGGAVGRMTHTEMAADIAKRNLAAVTPAAADQPQPNLIGYHWYSGTGGVSGGNNAKADLTWSSGVQLDSKGNPYWGGVQRERVQAGSQFNMPVIGSTRPTGAPAPDQSQAPAQYPTTQGNINFNVPGGSMQDVISRGLGSPYSEGDPSVGALDTAQRSTNQFGQQVISTPSGGQIITGARAGTPTPKPIKPDGWMDVKTGQQRIEGYGSAYGY